MSYSAIIDTGPLVAFFVQKEKDHQWVVDQFKEIHPPLLTCEPVLAEVCFLLQTEPQSLQWLKSFLEQGILKIGFSLSNHQEHVFSLMKKYSSVPMALADACLVCMTEIYQKHKLLTLDSDFKIYRRLRRKKIPYVIPNT